LENIFFPTVFFVDGLFLNVLIAMEEIRRHATRLLFVLAAKFVRRA
jgi:hypothetical protein